ncbi:MAG: helix-turn-helix domain containing protein [Clostridia bacterium]|nr:helix-turn-helix domain containing protein [Clostridia bacterium]
MYTRALRTKALREYRKSKSVNEICKDFNTSKSCMYSWIKLYSVKKMRVKAKNLHISSLNFTSQIR